VLIVFFPIAFGKTDMLGSARIFRLFNKHFPKFASINTRFFVLSSFIYISVFVLFVSVIGIGKELPNVLNAMRVKWNIQFPLLSDPHLSM